jgi:glycerol-3-phosphate acyltransferase PlsX
LLGINGVSVVCHGKSKAKVIANALTLAKSYASTGVIDLIQSKVEIEGAGEQDTD